MAPKQENFEATIITFRQVFDLSHKISVKICEETPAFDIVVGIARGGVTPARLLCDFLNIDNLTSLQIRHYEKGASQLEEASIIDPVDVEIEGKNVLLVDDVNDSGKTFEAAEEHLLSFKPRLLKTAVIHEKETTVFNADYVGDYQNEWRWLVYEWAVTEDVLEFLNRDDMLDADEDRALQHLQNNYGLELTPKHVQQVISMKENYVSDHSQQKENFNQ